MTDYNDPIVLDRIYGWTPDRTNEPLAQWEETVNSSGNVCRRKGVYYVNAPLPWARAGGSIDFLRSYWNRIRLAFDIQTTERILHVGASFGWFVSMMHETGHTQSWGVDLGSWYAARFAANRYSLVTVGPFDIHGAQRDRDLRRMTGDATFDWVFDETLTAYPVAEMQTMATDLEPLIASGNPARLVHIILTETQNADLIYMPNPITDGTVTRCELADWQRIAPTHRWITKTEGY